MKSRLPWWVLWRTTSLNITPKTVNDIHAASLVVGPSGPLRYPNGAVGLGCDSYHFLGERVNEKNGAFDGAR